MSNNIEDIESYSGSEDIDSQFERPTSNDFVNYDDVEDGEIFIDDDDYSSDNSADYLNTNGNENLNREINLQEYLTSKDQSSTTRYPGVSYSKCPPILQFACLPGEYFIHSIARYASSSDSEFTSGRIYFICPNGRDRFIEDWKNKYSIIFPDVEIRSLDNFRHATPNHIYSRDQFLSLKTTKWDEPYKYILDDMTKIELITLFK